MIKLRAHRLTRRFAVVSAASAIVLGGATAAASASTSAGTSGAGAPVKITQTMRVVGFDAAVAKAHGYQIRTDAQGRQYAVRAGAASDAVVAPENRLYGACGSSWMYYNAIGHRPTAPRFMANYSSGYQVILPTIAGTWVMYFQDRAGIGVITKFGATNGTNYWDSSGTTYHSLTGRSEAWVSTSSWVELDNGSICTSLGPSAVTNLY